MTISYVGAASANATTVSIPTHQAGDIIIMSVYRNASATAPTIPNLWMAALGGGGNSNWLGVFFLEATSDSMISGTWTDADHLSCVVYRPSTGNRLTISRTTTVATGTIGTGGSVAYGSLLALGAPEDAWIIGIAAHRSNDTDINIAPSGYTNRTWTAGGSAGELAVHDTNASASSVSSVNYVLTTGTSSAYRAVGLQLSEYEAAAAGGGASFPGANMPMIGSSGILVL